MDNKLKEHSLEFFKKQGYKDPHSLVKSFDDLYPAAKKDSDDFHKQCDNPQMATFGRYGSVPIYDIEADKDELQKFLLSDDHYCLNLMNSFTDTVQKNRDSGEFKKEYEVYMQHVSSIAKAFPKKCMDYHKVAYFLWWQKNIKKEALTLVRPNKDNNSIVLLKLDSSKNKELVPNHK
jgi:hypothetical protein